MAAKAKPLSERFAELRVTSGLARPKKVSKRHPDDSTALSNWLTHNEVKDSEISDLVLRLADHGMRVAEIEALMKQALLQRLAEIEANETEKDGEDEHGIT